MATARDEEVARAVGSIDGVESASVRVPGGVGTGHLRIVFAEGHDPREVARRVARRLDERFGLHISPEAIERLAADAGRGDEGTSSPKEPDAASGQAPEPAQEPTQEPTPEPAQGPGPEPAQEPTQEPPTSQPSASPTPEPPAPEAPTQPPTAGRPASDAPSPGRALRALIDRLELVGVGLGMEAHAVLSLNGATVEGVATGAATPHGRMRAAVNATVSALEGLLDGDARIEVDGLDVLGEARSRRVVVTVTLLTWDGPETHVGAALVRDAEPERAAMRATLDALNRRLVPLLRH